MAVLNCILLVLLLVLQGLREWQLSCQLPRAAGLIVPLCTFLDEKTGLCFCLSLYGGRSLEQVLQSAEWQQHQPGPVIQGQVHAGCPDGHPAQPGQKPEAT